MKAIIFHSNSDILAQISRVIQAAGHVVMATSHKPTQFAFLAAKAEPHLVVIGGQFDGANPLHVAAELSSWGFTERFHLIKEDPPSANDFEQILETLARTETTWSARPYAKAERSYFLDAQFDAYASEEKINRPQLDMDGKTLVEESNRFRAQISGARQNHSNAKRYLAAARRQHRGLAFECAYRAVHGSFKVFSWRAQILRYVATLAHYLSGLEIACLPRPSMPTPVVDFLHYGVPPEGYYALAAISSMGVKPSLDRLLRFSVRRTFQRQVTKDLEFEAIHLTGMAELMLQICTAQVRMMDRILDAESVFYHFEKCSHYDYRTEGIYADFWDFLHLRYSPSEWRKVARETLNDSNKPVGNFGVLSFAEFLRANSDTDNPQ